MRSPVEALRRGALRTIATMNDISDDEESPSYAAIHAPASLRDAQRALNFIRAMEQGSSSGAVMSTNLIWLPTLWAEEMLIHLQMEVQARLMRRPQRSSAVIGSLAKMTCQTQSFGFFWTTVDQIQSLWKFEALWIVQVQSVALHLSWNFTR